MQDYFLDSSALAKRYVREIGTAWVTQILHPTAGNAIHLARITGVEVVSAIARRGRTGSLPAPLVVAALAQLRADFGTIFHFTDLAPFLLDRAMDLAEVHPLRGYDAVQRAAALHVNVLCLRRGQSALTFVSADAVLNAAAAAEGLLVDDPNNHP